MDFAVQHYGHYWTLLCNPALLGCIASIANFCFQWGITLCRWETVIQPLIPKDLGVPQINWMWWIVLIEGNLNICLSKIFSHRMMLNAKTHGLLHKGQYGAWKGKMAISMVLLKCISYEIIWKTRMNACMFDNDATACYDHIIPSLAMLKCQWAGTPHPAINMVLKFLQCAKYHVHTAYGISTETFLNLIDYILGLIQGTGHAGPGWALTSSVMFEQMDTTHGTHFHSPWPNQDCHHTGEAFINDSSLWLLKLALALASIINLMQASAQKWEHLLYAMGGALNHAKCFWYGIGWTFNANGGCKMNDMPVPDDLDIKLMARDDLTTYHTIQWIPTTKGIWTLSVWLAPDSNDNNELQYQIQQVLLIKQHLSKAPLKCKHTNIVFHSI